MSDAFEDTELPNSGTASGESVVFDPAREFPGAVFMVPNSHWSIPGITSTDHPGACAFYLEARREGILVNGTDAAHPRWRHYLVVEPDEGNGLKKATVFALSPRYFRLHRLRLYFPERHIGRLDAFTLARLQAELARLHPEEG